jgi:hypothetical protein
VLGVLGVGVVRDTEIGEMHVRRGVFGDEDVGRLDVAMDERQGRKGAPGPANVDPAAGRAARERRRDARQVVDRSGVVADDPVGIAREQPRRGASADAAQVLVSAEDLRVPSARMPAVSDGRSKSTSYTINRAPAPTGRRSMRACNVRENGQRGNCARLESSMPTSTTSSPGPCAPRTAKRASTELDRTVSRPWKAAAANPIPTASTPMLNGLMSRRVLNWAVESGSVHDAPGALTSTLLRPSSRRTTTVPPSALTVVVVHVSAILHLVPFAVAAANLPLVLQDPRRSFTHSLREHVFFVVTGRVRGARAQDVRGSERRSVVPRDVVSATMKRPSRASARCGRPLPIACVSCTRPRVASTSAPLGIVERPVSTCARPLPGSVTVTRTTTRATVIDSPATGRLGGGNAAVWTFTSALAGSRITASPSCALTQSSISLTPTCSRCSPSVIVILKCASCFAARGEEAM